MIFGLGKDKKAKAEAAKPDEKAKVAEKSAAAKPAEKPAKAAAEKPAKAERKPATEKAAKAGNAPKVSTVSSADLKGLGISSERIHRLILAPVVSEKSTRVLDQGNQVVFKVLRDAAKPEIKIAVEKLFNVKVVNVQTLNVKGKNKGGQATRGRRSDWKKAYVTLAEGQQIDFAGGAKA